MTGTGVADGSVTGTGSADTSVTRRRAVEALRAGVPNRDAVAAMGSSQRVVETRFTELLERVRLLPRSGAHPGGLLVAGGFGSGKSHVLEHLRHLALEGGFMVSKVVVSKETPLHDPAKVFRAAVESAVLPDRQGTALAEIAAGLDFAGPAFADLRAWAHSPESGLNQRFAATLHLFENLRDADQEFSDLIVRFWGGEKMQVGELRKRLRELGEAATYLLQAVPERELALERFRFLSRLAKAGGYAGWVLLVDEVELIGRYSLLQRARSYAELARWVRGMPEDPAIPLLAVLTITDDFDEAVLHAKNDLEVVPNKLRARQNPADDLMAGQAEVGMRIIEREVERLRPPDEVELDRAYNRLKEIHGEAYGWAPPDVEGLERLGTTRMRQYVRAWINEWDLVRLDPGYRPETQVIPLASGYQEDTDLEGSTEPTAGPATG